MQFQLFSRRLGGTGNEKQTDFYNNVAMLVAGMRLSREEPTTVKESDQAVPMTLALSLSLSLSCELTGLVRGACLVKCVIAYGLRMISARCSSAAHNLAVT